MDLEEQLAEYTRQPKKSRNTPKPKVMPDCEFCNEPSEWRIGSRGKHKYFCRHHSPWNSK